MWQLPTTTFEIGPGEIHLWRGLCVPESIDLARHGAMLTPVESARAVRLATDTLRRRFVQAHLLLHILLGNYAPLSDKSRIRSPQLELAYQSNGKPYLVAPQLDPLLEFNMSHAGEMVMIALARGRAVGADVEMIRPLHDLDGMVTTVCTKAEREHLASQPIDTRLTEFYHLWTRKEAWLKMRGEGIAASLASVEVCGTPQGVVLLDIPPTKFGGEEYIGAVALPEGGEPPQVQVWDVVWQPS